MADINVTTEEQDAYYRYAFNEIRKRFATNPPPTLWHYTTGEALVSIVTTNRLWATQISCLNDASELRYSTHLLRRAFLDRPPAEDGSDEHFIFQQIMQRLSTDNAPTSEWFVSCLTQCFDDLSQWRAYGGGEGGYAIQLDANLVSNAAAKDSVFLAKVNYDSAMHREMATSVAGATVQHFVDGLAHRPNVDRGEWASKFLPAWSEAITYLAPVVKHDGFSKEEEWRLIRRLRRDDFALLKYTQRKSLLARHLPLRLPAQESAELLPISGIVVGPSRHKDISAVSVKTLLMTAGYPQPTIDMVISSRIPFQGT